MRLIEEVEVRFVLDADGLQLVASESVEISSLSERPILTPHPGEMSALTGTAVDEIQGDREGVAAEYAKVNGCVVALKGDRTVVADGDRLYVVHPRDSRIAVIDTDSESPTYHEQVELIATPGKTAWRMCFNPDTTLAWVLLEPWELALLDTNPVSSSYHTIVERRPIGFDCRFLLHAPPDKPMNLYLFDNTHGMVRVLAPSTQ